MMLFLHVYIVAILLVYVFLILSFFFGWKKLRAYTPSDKKKITTFVSVVVAYRNEENNLEELITSLNNQHLSKDSFEVILINDHSTDNSKEVAVKFCNLFRVFNTYDLPENITGKKAAIRFGIEQAKADLIVTTDADCYVKPKWLKTIINFYELKKASIISAPVVLKDNKAFFSKFQSLEFMSLVGSGAGSIGIGRPIMCNAANMAFTKKSFYKNQNEHNNKFASGDDVFLLLNQKKQDRNSIHFLKSHEAIVYTKPKENLKEFLHQRIRWVSKSRGYKDFDLIFTSFVIYIFNLSIIIAIAATFFIPAAAYYMLALILCKSIVDFIFLYSIADFFKKKKLIKMFPLMQAITILYTVLIPVLTLIIPAVWKGRKVS